MASADSSSVSANDHDSLSFTEKPTENLDTAGESPQASESSSTIAPRKRQAAKDPSAIGTVRRYGIANAVPTPRLLTTEFEAMSGISITSKFPNNLRLRSLVRTTQLTDCLDCKLRDRKGMILSRRNTFSLRLVEWPEWYALLHTVNHMAPRVVTQSRGQVPKLLEEGFTPHRQTLITKLKFSLAQVHFSIDTWSSPNHHSLLAIVTHFINLDSRQLCKTLLALRELEGSHSGEAIAETFLRVINSYGIQDKIGYFTLDNAYNDTMMQAIAKVCGFNAAHRRLRCNGHVINLAVQALLFGKNKDASDEALRQVSQLSYDEQEGAVKRAETATTWRQYGALGMRHNLVVWIRSSSQRYQAFLKVAGRMIPQDNSTRWNSWYLMVHVAITLRKEINSFIDDHYMEGDIKLDYLHPEHW
ncbi:Uncharacterized protein HZ326_22641 [Fusarium oxysporum f. sp. albedinis]|nr:Uncharacterized protein HZ326_22641 [Fusarium oxysporum f. sp. albedinis]